MGKLELKHGIFEVFKPTQTGRETFAFFMLIVGGKSSKFLTL
jgi:hypothetical protein